MEMRFFLLYNLTLQPCQCITESKNKHICQYWEQISFFASNWWHSHTEKKNYLSGFKMMNFDSTFRVGYFLRTKKQTNKKPQPK